MSDSQGEQFALLQEALDEIMAGRTKGHVCPFCGGGPLEVPSFDSGGVRVECPDCRRFFEGTFR